MNRSDLELMVQQSQFTPSGTQIRARERFWKKIAGTEHEDLDLDLSLRLGAPAALTRWWNIPGFADWWTSLEWEREESHRLLIEAMHKVGGVLRDEDDSARILAAAKEAREIYAKLHGGEKEARFADEDIGKMTREQLEAYITRNTASK